jgi:hypothetical protein
MCGEKPVNRISDFGTMVPEVGTAPGIGTGIGERFQLLRNGGTDFVSYLCMVLLQAISGATALQYEWMGISLETWTGAWVEDALGAGRLDVLAEMMNFDTRTVGDFQRSVAADH